MCKNIDGLNGKAGKIVDWTLVISRVLIIPLLSLMLYGWWNHERRIHDGALNQAIVSGNRFTSEDGLEVWKEIAEIRGDVLILSAQQAAHLRESLPASELVGRSEYVKDYLEHDRRIGRLEAKP